MWRGQKQPEKPHFCGYFCSGHWQKHFCADFCTLYFETTSTFVPISLPLLPWTPAHSCMQTWAHTNTLMWPVPHQLCFSLPLYEAITQLPPLWQSSQITSIWIPPLPLPLHLLPFIAGPCSIWRPSPLSLWLRSHSVIIQHGATKEEGKTRDKRSHSEAIHKPSVYLQRSNIGSVSRYNPDPWAKTQECQRLKCLREKQMASWEKGPHLPGLFNLAWLKLQSGLCALRWFHIERWCLLWCIKAVCCPCSSHQITFAVQSTAAVIRHVIKVWANQIALHPVFNYANSSNLSKAAVMWPRFHDFFAIYQPPAEIQREKSEKTKRKCQQSSEFSSQSHTLVKPVEHDSKIAKMAS